MRRTIAIAQPLPAWDGYPGVFRRDPGTWLPEARPSGLDTWTCQVGPSPGLRRPVTCRVGSVWVTDGTAHRSIHWTPETTGADLVQADRVLPRLDGRLHLTESAGRRSLLLEGEVSPPLGVLGDAIDHVLLRRVGDATVREFLLGIVARMLPPALVPVVDGSTDVAGAVG